MTADVLAAPVLEIRVLGVPTTQGSKNAFVVNSKSGPRAVVVDVKRHALRSWRDSIRADVIDCLGPNWEPIQGPIGVALRFALPKPASAPKRRRTWPIGARSGDIDKLERAVLDALTDAGLWKDDGQVVTLQGDKDYPGVTSGLSVPGVQITVWQVATS